MQITHFGLKSNNTALSCKVGEFVANLLWEGWGIRHTFDGKAFVKRQEGSTDIYVYERAAEFRPHLNIWELR